MQKWCSMSVKAASSLQQDNSELKELFQSYLDSHRERLTFKRNALGYRENPWNYQNYIYVVKICLKSIEKIFESLKIEGENYFSETTLSHAHIICNNPKDAIGDKVFQYRNVTVESAKNLCTSFDTLCMNLQVHAMKLKIRGFDRGSLIDNLSKFKVVWNNFESNLLSDQNAAKKHFASRSHL